MSLSSLKNAGIFDSNEAQCYDSCEDCKKSLCIECESHHWKYQLQNDPNGVVRYKGCMVIFDNRGVGKKYCMKCYKSKDL